MNPAPIRTPSLVSRGAGRALLALLIVTLAPPLRPADDQSPKDHSIFVGVDVSVAWRGKYYRVIGTDKNAVRIMLDGKVTVLPLTVLRDIHVNRGVKLSNRSATVTNLHGAKGTNRAQAAAEAAAMQNTMAMQSMAENARDSAVANAGYVANISSPGADGSAANLGADATKQVMAPLLEIENSINQLAKTNKDLHLDDSGPGGDLGSTGFVVSFEVSAPGPLDECHVAIIATYTIPGASGVTLNKVSFLSLGTLDLDPRKVTCELRGFPAGAELEGYRVALYSNSQEVATNLSARRTEVTRDEALIFLITDYLAGHPGATLPPAPILMVPRSEFVLRLGDAPLDLVIYARVNKDGKIIRLSTNASGSGPLPSDLNLAVDQIAFVPALEKGKPVEGVAKFKLADLVASN